MQANLRLPLLNTRNPVIILKILFACLLNVKISWIMRQRMIKSISLYTFVPAILSFMVGFVKICGAYGSFSLLIHVLNSTI